MNNSCYFSLQWLITQAEGKINLLGPARFLAGVELTNWIYSRYCNKVIFSCTSYFRESKQKSHEDVVIELCESETKERSQISSCCREEAAELQSAPLSWHSGGDACYTRLCSPCLSGCERWSCNRVGLSSLWSVEQCNIINTYIITG